MPPRFPIKYHTFLLLLGASFTIAIGNARAAQAETSNYSEPVTLLSLNETIADSVNATTPSTISSSTPAGNNNQLPGSPVVRFIKERWKEETQVGSLPDSPVATGVDTKTGKPYQNSNDSSNSSTQSSEFPPRRALPAPYDPVFPATEFIGSATALPIGVPDTNPAYPLERAIWQACPMLKKARIQIYGWGDGGMNYSTSHNSNIPLSYAIVPRHMELDQACLRIERVPDTVQTEHMDWGFRITGLYGIDYRWTTAQGWYPASNELLYHNKLYGFDPVECYGSIYIPKIAQGLVLKFGRYISPPDIEAQLSPDNYLWTHSVMFTYDCYTQTGMLASLMLNKNWMIQGGIHAGDDIAPWNKAAIPTGEFFVRWISNSNKDSIYAGMDSVNSGSFRHGKLIANNEINAANAGVPMPPIMGHDNLQQTNITWSHKFNNRINMQTEAYFLYQFHALTGGTVNNGPPIPAFELVGPGKPISGVAAAWGLVNYINCKISKRDYITLRPIDLLDDCKGERSGFKTMYGSWTLGWTHRFSDLICIRPEIRYERAFNYTAGNIVTPYDNGNRRYQFTFGADIIQRF